MSLRPEIKTGNFSRDSNSHIWCGNESATAVAVLGTSRDIHSIIRTISYVTSGQAGLLLRFDENANKSRQYYKLRVDPTSNFAAIEEVNHSTAWDSPTVLASRAYNIAENTSFFLAFDVVAVNGSQDKLRGFIDDLEVVNYASTLSLSSGQQGFIVQQGEARFDRNSIYGEEIDYYCTVQDVKNLLSGLGVATVTDDGEIMSIIAKASQHINKLTGTVFGRLIRVTNERHTGQGEISVITHHLPLKILSKIDIYNYTNTLVDSLVPGDDDYTNLIIEEETGEITRPAKTTTVTAIYGTGQFPVSAIRDYTYPAFDYSQYFGSGRRNIILDYLYGHDDVPSKIREAVRKMIGVDQLIKIGNYNTQGAAMVRLGDAMEDYRVRGTSETGSLPFSGAILRWKKDIEEALKEWDVLTFEAV